MTGVRWLRSAGAIALAMTTLYGCASSGTQVKSKIRQLDSSYEEPKSASLPKDIKDILAAGGLDTRNPSAPTAETSGAEVNSVTSTPEVVHQVAAALAAETDTASPLALAKPMTTEPTPLTVASDEPVVETFVYPSIGVETPAVEAAPEKPKKKTAQPKVKQSATAATKSARVTSARPQTQVPTKVKKRF